MNGSIKIRSCAIDARLEMRSEMEKYYGSKGRYTCNGYIPISERRQRRPTQCLVILAEKLFIVTAILVILAIIAWAVPQVFWLNLFM